jgi:electron transfer flavoprotein alpha subunit
VDAAEPNPARTGDVVPLNVDIASAIRVRSIERVEQAADGMRMEDARVVVSGGRGLGGPEPFEQLQQLATVLGGAVGASRAACDAGWVPSSYQVGLTGKTVTPDLYIAIGISGASQHMAGCSNARAIVAINKDAGANIFKEARFGVAGDWQKVLPAFMEQLHELLD